LNPLEISRTNPENSLLRSDSLGASPFEKRPKFTHRAGAHEIKRGNLFAELFITVDKDASVCKSKFTNHFREKGGFFYARFDQENL
jgi:hypothetical protein